MLTLEEILRPKRDASQLRTWLNEQLDGVERQIRADLSDREYWQYQRDHATDEGEIEGFRQAVDGHDRKIAGLVAKYNQLNSQLQALPKEKSSGKAEAAGGGD